MAGNKRANVYSLGYIMGVFIELASEEEIYRLWLLQTPRRLFQAA